MNILLDRNAEEIQSLPIGEAQKIKEFLKRHHIPEDQPVQINFGEFLRPKIQNFKKR